MMNQILAKKLKSMKEITMTKMKSAIVRNQTLFYVVTMIGPTQIKVAGMNFQNQNY